MIKVTLKQRALSQIAETDPIRYSSLHGRYGPFCLYNCKFGLAVGGHDKSCPWEVFKKLPEVRKAVEAVRAEEAERQAVARKKAEQEAHEHEVAEYRRLKKKLGL